MSAEFEQVLLSFHKDGMLDFLRTHPEEIPEALSLALEDRQPFSWRSAWVLWSYFSEGFPFPDGASERILKAIPGKKDGHQRELLKMLWISGLDEEDEGEVFDLCVTLWEDIRKNPSIRVTAMKWMFRIAGPHAELAHELPYYLQDKFVDPLSPGVKRSLQRLAKEYLPD